MVMMTVLVLFTHITASTSTTQQRNISPKNNKKLQPIFHKKIARKQTREIGCK